MLGLWRFSRPTLRLRTADFASDVACQTKPLGAKSGPRRDRTADLYTASVALSQLSYEPLEK